MCAGDQVQSVVLAVAHNGLLYKPGKYVLFADIEHVGVGVMFPCILSEVVQIDRYDFS